MPSVRAALALHQICIFITVFSVTAFANIFLLVVWSFISDAKLMQGIFNNFRFRNFFNQMILKLFKRQVCTAYNSSNDAFVISNKSI